MGTATDLAYDMTGRLLVSGFGLFPPDIRRAVRVYDPAMQPLWAFGEEGVGPGQFLAPSGIALWGPPCTYGGPYSVDDHTSLLLHFDGDYTGAEGEIGTATGVTFTTGFYGQGVLITDTHTLSYTVTGNLTHTYGAVEFWVRPNWDGDGGSDHTFFWWEDGSERLHLRKDPISNLVFDYFYAGGGCGSATNIAHWRAGEWHHVGFSWAENEISLYVDGQQVSRNTCGGTAKPTTRDFYIGSKPDGSNTIAATVDEMRISDILRLGNSNTCARILVADSANHRIQAFDHMGNFLSAYGDAPGTLLGQLNTPQGLAVDSDGQVIVVDQGNDRLVTLSFDGTNLDLVRVIAASLNQPTDVATFGDYIVVADTGNNTVKVLDAAGTLLSTYTAPRDGYTGPFQWPSGVAVDAMGTIIVADTGNGRVVTLPYALSPYKVWLPLVIRH